MSKPLQQDGASPNSRILFLVNPAHSQPCQNPSTNPVGAGGAGQKEAWGARGNLLVSFWMLLEQPGVQALLVKNPLAQQTLPRHFSPYFSPSLARAALTLAEFWRSRSRGCAGCCWPLRSARAVGSQGARAGERSCTKQMIFEPSALFSLCLQEGKPPS